MTGEEIYFKKFNERTRRSALNQYGSKESVFEFIEKCVLTMIIVENTTEDEAVDTFVSFILEYEEESNIEGIIL